MQTIFNALVTGLAHKAGNPQKDLVAVRGTAKVSDHNKGRIVVKDDTTSKWYIFENGSGQILEQ